MPVETLLSFIIASVILGLIPGPSVCFTIAHGLKFGAFRTVPSIFGQLSANGLQLFIVFIGLNRLLEQSIGFFYVMKILGAAYLIYLGIKQWRAEKPELHDSSSLHSENSLKSFMDGFIVCVSNPKAILFYGAFLPQFIAAQYDYKIQFLILGITSLIILGFVLLVYTSLAGQTRSWFIDNDYWRVQNRLTGALMIGAGTALAVTYKK